MMYLLAVIAPPIAVLFSGKPFQAILNVFLTLIVWLPGAIHAVLVVKERKDDARMRKYFNERR
ncbi:MAG TPA: YqaE/Pmp3 family membrane protein [Aliicoccus persicus]|uniref:YqaE/Pmp3 family membrane protein n=1 Tax=Aliicoccus persicus TaxID=930138 RepID=A0A921B4P9_9STAP|nr:YqaE/Pmp3 family membrane protein [Aliicoccus persicus]